MAKPKLLICSAQPPRVLERAYADFEAIDAGEGDFLPDEVVRRAAEQQSEVIMFTLRTRMNAETIGALPASVKVLSAVSVGYEHIDLDAAKARGMVVTITPDVLTNSNADMAMLLILAACRRAKELHGLMQDGWRRRQSMNDLLGRQVTGRTLGIIGMGRIGRAVAQRARGFEMEILYHNRSRLSPELEQGATYFADLDAMLPHCEILSLHAPGGGGVLMTRERFLKLPKGAVFVNEARGQLVDEEAMIELLTSGHLAAAGLDVFKSEPDFDLRLRDLPNVFLTPHMGSATLETRTAMGLLALDNAAAALAGAPQNRVGA